MSFVAIAVGAAAVIGAAGSIYAAKKKQQALEYNAKVLESQAEMERIEEVERQVRLQKEKKLIFGKQLAARAASGVDVGTGSSLLLEAETAAELKLQSLDSFRASNNRIARYSSEAMLARRSGKTAVTTSYFEAGATLIGGASRISSL